jgi:predicted choloylglycine hydrolase
LIREYNNLNLEIVLNQLDNLLTIDNITNNNLNENSQHEDLSLNSTSKPIDINKSNIIDVKFNTSPNNSYSYSISPKESFLLYKDIFDMSTNNKKTDFDKLQNKLLILKNINIQKCITWCNKYNLPVNKDIF